MVVRISVPSTTLRRSSAFVSLSRSKPDTRDQRPMYIEGVLRLDAADPLECPRERQGGALEQELAGEQCAIQLALRQRPLGGHNRKLTDPCV